MKLDLLFVRFLTILALAVGGLAIVPSDAHADPAPHWTSLGGPEGGWVAIIAIDPGSPSNVYARNNPAGLIGAYVSGPTTGIGRVSCTPYTPANSAAESWAASSAESILLKK